MTTSMRDQVRDELERHGVALDGAIARALATVADTIDAAAALGPRFSWNPLVDLQYRVREVEDRVGQLLDPLVTAGGGVGDAPELLGELGEASGGAGFGHEDSSVDDGALTLDRRRRALVNVTREQLDLTLSQALRLTDELLSRFPQ